MSTTTPDNLPAPDPGTMYGAVQAFKGLADETQNALNRRANFYRGTMAQRQAFTNAPNGVHWQETDENQLEYVRLNGGWTSVHPQNLLWSAPNGIYLRESQTINLEEPVNAQATGIILEWSRYVSGTAVDYGRVFQFIPRTAIFVNGYCSSILGVFTNPPTLAVKGHFITNTTITGHVTNATGNQAEFVLTAVYGC